MGRLTIVLIIVTLCLPVAVSRSKRCIYNTQGQTSTPSPCSHHKVPVTTLSSSETTTTTFTTTANPTSASITTTSSTTTTSTTTTSTTSSSLTIGLNTECGMLSGKQTSKRVVGGNTTNPHEWPSICRLQFLHPRWRDEITGCGSTLIKNHTGHFYIITAAHCIRYNDTKEYTVRCGVHDLRGDSPSHEQKFEVTKIINHWDYFTTYDGKSKVAITQHDISILELKTQPNENAFVNAACLPSVDVHAGEASFVAGWGFQSVHPYIKADTLQDLAKPIVSNEKCEAVFNNALLYNSTQEFELDCKKNGMLCAGYVTSGKGACFGDSGGPLYTERDGLWTLAGVVSFGIPPCAQDHFVDVYTDVYHHLEWINSEINHD